MIFWKNENCWDRNHIIGCQGSDPEVGEGNLTTKGHERTIWDNGKIHSLDYGDNYMTVYIYKNA